MTPPEPASYAPLASAVGGTGAVDPIAVGSRTRASSRARILDRGYRRYDGKRLGRRAAITALTWSTFQRSLGIRRSVWAKVFPLLAVFIAYVPAIVFVGVTALVKDNPQGDDFVRNNFLPPYAAYYGFVWAAILVFVGFVAPEVLCTDRRNGLFGLYLASPLDRSTYLLAKALAVSAAVSLVTIGPPVLYLVGLTLNDHGPDGFGEFLSTFGEVLIAGVAVAALPVALSMAVSATTTRRAAASVSIIMILLSSAVLIEVLVNVAELTPNLFVFDILFLPFELVFRIFNDGFHLSTSWAEVDTSVLVIAYFAWTLGFAAFVWVRYHRLQVTR